MRVKDAICTTEGSVGKGALMSEREFSGLHIRFSHSRIFVGARSVMVVVRPGKWVGLFIGIHELIDLNNHDNKLRLQDLLHISMAVINVISLVRVFTKSVSYRGNTRNFKKRKRLRPKWCPKQHQQQTSSYPPVLYYCTFRNTVFLDAGNGVQKSDHTFRHFILRTASPSRRMAIVMFLIYSVSCRASGFRPDAGFLRVQMSNHPLRVMLTTTWS